MINELIDSISIAINSEFGDEYEIYTESIKQGFNEPCFFIYNFNSTNDLFLGKRYFRENQFCINYFPNKGNENKECHSVAERLYKCLEWLNAQGDLLRGTGLKHDILDGVLNFYVNYNAFYHKTEDTIPMGNISQRLNVKE